MNYKTPSHKSIRPYDLEIDNVDLRDIVLLMSRQLVFGGISKEPYTKLEHAFNMHNFYINSHTSIMMHMYRRGVVDENKYNDLPRNEVCQMFLLHGANVAVCNIEDNQVHDRKHHYAFIMSTILKGLGLSHKTYKVIEPILNYVDDRVRNSLIPGLQKTDVFLPREEAVEYWIATYKKYNDSIYFKNGKICFT